ncbi:unnamed protein product [Mycena citricolor]|uniref:Uncharacterized protein n=1 Tax=Mycena citricolor TaxID=2018698 RepID=A0AAD2HC15_9AGAR|nr:unnamed protein product [Mycena citricolor]
MSKADSPGHGPACDYWPPCQLRGWTRRQAIYNLWTATRRAGSVRPRCYLMKQDCGIFLIENDRLFASSLPRISALFPPLLSLSPVLLAQASAGHTHVQLHHRQHQSAHPVHPAWRVDRRNECQRSFGRELFQWHFYLVHNEGGHRDVFVQRNPGVRRWSEATESRPVLGESGRCHADDRRFLAKRHLLRPLRVECAA